MSNEYKILAAIYALLGEFGEDDFKAAARNVRGNREVSDALAALSAARHRARYDRNGGHLSEREPQPRNEPAPQPRAPEEDRSNAATSSPSTRPPPERRRGSGPTPRSLRPTVRRALLSDAFPSAAALARFLDSLKLGRTFRPRDGREKMVEQALAAIDSGGRVGYVDVIRAANARIGSSQTAGWMEVIKDQR